MSITPNFLEAYFPEKFFSLEKNTEEPVVMDNSSAAYSDGVGDATYQVPFYSDDEGVFIPVGTSMKEVEERMIEVTLQHTKGNRTKAAKILGIGIRTLRRKLNEQ